MNSPQNFDKENSAISKSEDDVPINPIDENKINEALIPQSDDEQSNEQEDDDQSIDLTVSPHVKFENKTNE